MIIIIVHAINQGLSGLMVQLLSSLPLIILMFCQTLKEATIKGERGEGGGRERGREEGREEEREGGRETKGERERVHKFIIISTTYFTRSICH